MRQRTRFLELVCGLVLVVAGTAMVAPWQIAVIIAGAAFMVDAWIPDEQ